MHAATIIATPARTMLVRHCCSAMRGSGGAVEARGGRKSTRMAAHGGDLASIFPPSLAGYVGSRSQGLSLRQPGNRAAMMRSTSRDGCYVRVRKCSQLLGRVAGDSKRQFNTGNPPHGGKRGGTNEPSLRDCFVPVTLTTCPGRLTGVPPWYLSGGSRLGSRTKARFPLSW